jgi:predicted CopG family antitoxin
LGRKRITVTDETYDALVKRKRPEESFTEEITRLLGRRQSQKAAHDDFDRIYRAVLGHG